MNNLLFFLGVIFLAYFIYFLINFFRQKRIPNNTVIAFTGGLGSGKTYLGVRTAIRHHRFMLFLFWLKIIKEKPLFLSNIPILISKKFMSDILTYQHLTLQQRIPQHSTVFIDEVGQIASQYDYDNPFIMQYVQEFIRLFRHYIDGKLILTDQTASSIVVNIRRRINTIYNLTDFRRVFIFFFKVDVSQISIVEDLVNVQQVTQLQELPYFFGLLPFKYFNFLNKLLRYKKHYDSKCYSINYKAPIVHKENSTWPLYLKTDYFIEVPNNQAMRKEYKVNGFINQDRMAYYLIEWQNKDKKEPKKLDDPVQISS
jgi:hypothetical protein